MLAPVREYVAARGPPRSDDCPAHGGRACAGCSGRWPRSKVVTIYSGGDEPVYAIERGQHLVAAFYRNSAIHHFVDRAIAELVLLERPGRPVGGGGAGCATCSSSSSSSPTGTPIAISSPAS